MQPKSSIMRANSGRTLANISAAVIFLALAFAGFVALPMIVDYLQ